MEIQFSEKQALLVATCVKYMEANWDDHSLYYVWKVLDMGCRDTLLDDDENELSQAKIESNDKQCGELLEEVLKILSLLDADAGAIAKHLYVGTRTFSKALKYRS